MKLLAENRAGSFVIGIFPHRLADQLKRQRRLFSLRRRGCQFEQILGFRLPQFGESIPPLPRRGRRHQLFRRDRTVGKHEHVIHRRLPPRQPVPREFGLALQIVRITPNTQIAKLRGVPRAKLMKLGRNVVGRAARLQRQRAQNRNSKRDQ